MLTRRQFNLATLCSPLVAMVPTVLRGKEIQKQTNVTYRNVGLAWLHFIGQEWRDKINETLVFNINPQELKNYTIGSKTYKSYTYIIGNSSNKTVNEMGELLKQTTQVNEYTIPFCYYNSYQEVLTTIESMIKDFDEKVVVFYFSDKSDRSHVGLMVSDMKSSPLFTVR